MLGEELSITEFCVKSDMLIATISDGRVVSVPIVWFSRLQNASLDQLGNFEISPSGGGIHWPDMDEDISIKSFLNQ
jgi:hypothetical protein